ncbi:mitochondrial ubiquitin ligase activator of nfkb 1-A [Scleropages formosus]|uniref:RING-type E3 ubiquitin transferase n=2 Tax=Scleropages formosus TaxID=113540 RepID=A0A8C9RKD6_SCLFO|nr:mitochondrial ubiquitin ligase activator of nfkb 1-A-like [Scleropages formosus]
MSNILIDWSTLCAGSTLAFSGLFYYLYQQEKTKIKKLKAVPKFEPGETLLKVVRATPYKRLQYVAVEGVVQPEGDLLTSQYVPGCTGVMQKVIVQEHWREWDSVARLWRNRSMNQQETNNTVPFSLVAPGAGAGGVAIKVREPREAKGLHMEQVYKRRRCIPQGVADFALLGLTGAQPVEQEVREEMLRVGTEMTALGEVVLEGGRMLRLQPPQDRQQYLLYPNNYKSFLQMHHNVANMWKWLGGFCGITGTSLLTWAVCSRLGDTRRGR